MLLEEAVLAVIPDEETTLADAEAHSAARELSLRSALVAAFADAQSVAGDLDALRVKVQMLAAQAPEGSALSRLCARIDGVQLPSLDPALQRLGLEMRREALLARHQALTAAEAQLTAFRDDLTKLYAQISVGTTAVEAYAKRQAAAGEPPAGQPVLVLRDTTSQAAARGAPPGAGERAPSRESPRAPLEVAVTFESRSNFYVGFARDISRGGVFVATDAPLPHATPVTLELALPEGTVLSVAGEVRWSREYDRSAPETVPGMGIQFTSLSSEALAAIESFVSTRVPLMIPT